MSTVEGMFHASTHALFSPLTYLRGLLLFSAAIFAATEGSDSGESARVGDSESFVGFCFAGFSEDPFPSPCSCASKD